MTPHASSSRVVRSSRGRTTSLRHVTRRPELLEESSVVPIIPVLDYLAVDYPDQVDAGPSDPSASRRNGEKLAALFAEMRSDAARADDDSIPHGKDLFDGVLHVGKYVVQSGEPRL